MFDTNTIMHDVVTRVTRHYREIGKKLDWEKDTTDAIVETYPTPLHADIALFLQIANGELDRSAADEQMIGDIVERLQQFLDLLFLPAHGRLTYSIPSSFWVEPGIGQVLVRVQAWLRQDDLISFTEAAQSLFPELAENNIQAARMRIKRLTENGTLMMYLDPDEPNPTQQTRVSRQAIEAFRAAGQGDPHTG